MNSAGNACLAENSNGAKFKIDENDEDADEINNDTDTSTSFSLQECMNEFRARRIRRSSLGHRQDKNSTDNYKNEHGITELDLIKQNLCNKEQERKCKPCENGFCYCFTSDSGDGGGGNLGGCLPPTVIPAKNARRNTTSEFSPFLYSVKRTAKNPRSNEGSSYLRKSSLKSTMKPTNRLKAISNLETSKEDAPLIQIIQELRDNCVISTVKVNKYKIRSISKNSHSITNFAQTEHFPKDKNDVRKTSFATQQETFGTASDKYTPTAPILEQDICIGTAENKNILSSPLETNKKKLSDCSDERYSAGGQLLHKRISKLQYKPRNINHIPAKPPRASSTYNEYQESLESTSSVRAAEQVVSNFLAHKGYTNNNHTKGDSGQSEMFPLTSSKHRKQTENYFSTYPSLNNARSSRGTETLSCYDKNITQTINNLTKRTTIGWSEPKIQDMLTYDANMKEKEFHSNSTHAQPQQISNSYMAENENSIGWQIPPKINLDTVDGIAHHNLASYSEDKTTPIKTKLISPSQCIKDGTRRQHFLWSEQLKHLSPWSNKCNMNDTRESKQSFRCSSKAFITSSKKRLMRLVSPKKVNSGHNSIQMHNVAVQTSCKDISCSQSNIHNQYEDGSNEQSPPGSYHSPMHSSHAQYMSSTHSQNTTANGTEPKFDFSRTVHSPPKKEYHSSQRKLNFPAAQNNNSDNQQESYLSFNKDLDQESRISYILSNIRAKLEASDQHAVRTFLETESFDNRNYPFGFKCSGGEHHKKQIGESTGLHKSSQLSKANTDYCTEPIYSEIEDESVYISESPDFGNHTGIQHFVAADNPDVLYAKVNKGILDKAKLQSKELKTTQTPLAKIIQDSLKSKKIISNIVPLPTLPEPLESESTSYSLPLSSNVSLSHYKSLNNVHMTECNSSPGKQQRILNKSNLSLHRSDFFLENLCKSELIAVDAGDELKNVEDLQSDNNNIPNTSYVSMWLNESPNNSFSVSGESNHDFAHNDNVSYELANGAAVEEDVTELVAHSNLGLGTIIPPSSNNQSTPKKQAFVAKGKSVTSELNVAAETVTSDYLYNSCPISTSKQSDIYVINQGNPSHSFNENEVSNYGSVTKSNVKIVNALQRYKSLKSVLHNSFRKSKRFIKNEGKRLSTSLNLLMNKDILSSTSASGKSLHVDPPELKPDVFLSISESANVCEQIAQTVSICRKLPDLAISREMVEAERLLLFSTLCRGNQGQLSSAAKRNHTMIQKATMRFFIDDMFLSARSDINMDTFFNYFYIITFDCGGIIKSTQSAECVNGEAMFRDNGIEFVYYPELEANTLMETKQTAVKCNIFMLRLRKITTAFIEPKKKEIVENLSPSSTLKSISSSSSNEIVSRFRFHASFTLDAKDFVPYEYVHQESKNSDRICIRASCLCTLPLKARTKLTELSRYIRLKGRADVRIPKYMFDGFLNVQDPQKQHNWNRRWCTLDGIFLYVWQDKNSLSTAPLIAIDLRDSKHNINSPLSWSSKELCARPRSFCLECRIDKSCQDVSANVSVYFAADTQENAEDWLKSLNLVLDFIATWL